MKATCPQCFHEFEVKRRAVGLGTAIDPATPLTFTEGQVLQQVDKARLDVRGIQNRLIAVSTRKNYHQVQAALSTLVGRGMVFMDTSSFPPKYYRD